MTLLIASIFIILFILELLYFKIADHYNITDKPNHRSSHTEVTVRGGGVVFGFATIIFFFTYGFQYPYFISGLILIALISFLDDILTLNNKVRLTVHLISVLLLFCQWGLFSMSWYWLVIAAVFVIGVINAYNFMDGINGITGSYSLLAIATFYFINEHVVKFSSSEFLIIIGLSLLVFNFFNFRTRAKCFAGDVGSVSIAFIIIFLLGQLIIVTENFNYILLLLLYGLDAVITIIFRLIRKENIFKAHRSHFYQFLANEKKISHLVISAIYFFIQLGINCLLIFYVKDSSFLSFGLILLSSLLYLGLRIGFEGQRLIKRDLSLIK